MVVSCTLVSQRGWEFTSHSKSTKQKQLGGLRSPQMLPKQVMVSWNWLVALHSGSQGTSLLLSVCPHSSSKEHHGEDLTNISKPAGGNGGPRSVTSERALAQLDLHAVPPKPHACAGNMVLECWRSGFFDSLSITPLGRSRHGISQSERSEAKVIPRQMGRTAKTETAKLHAEAARFRVQTQHRMSAVQIRRITLSPDQ